MEHSNKSEGKSQEKLQIDVPVAEPPASNVGAQDDPAFDNAVREINRRMAKAYVAFVDEIKGADAAKCRAIAGEYIIRLVDSWGEPALQLFEDVAAYDWWLDRRIADEVLPHLENFANIPPKFFPREEYFRIQLDVLRRLVYWHAVAVSRKSTEPEAIQAEIESGKKADGAASKQGPPEQHAKGGAELAADRARRRLKSITDPKITERVNELMKNRGLTVRSVAAAAKEQQIQVSANTLYTSLHDDKYSFRLLNDLSAVFGVPVQQLVVDPERKLSEKDRETLMEFYRAFATSIAKGVHSGSKKYIQLEFDDLRSEAHAAAWQKIRSLKSIPEDLKERINRCVNERLRQYIQKEMDRLRNERQLNLSVDIASPDGPRPPARPTAIRRDES